MSKTILGCIACAVALIACTSNPPATSSMGNAGASPYSSSDRGATGVSTSGDPLTSNSTGSASPLPTDSPIGQKKPAE